MDELQIEDRDKKAMPNLDDILSSTNAVKGTCVMFGLVALGIATNDTIILADDKCTAGTAALIFQGAIYQPVVEGIIATVKFGHLMTIR